MRCNLVIGKLFSLIVLFLFMGVSAVKAEGIYQFGSALNQPLRSTSTVFIHVPNAGDLIRVHLCRRGNSGSTVIANISDTTIVSDQYVANTTLANLSSVGANIDCADPMTNPLPRTPAIGDIMEFAVPSAGVYAIEFSNNSNVSYDRWDFSVVPSGTPNAAVDATADSGSVFSYQWIFDTDSFGLAAGATGRMFILVPGGFPSTNYVWALDLQEFSGNVYEIVANDLGLDAPVSGISAPTSGNNVTNKYPVYLTYPTAANPSPAPTQFPALTDTLVFVDDAGNDAVISPDGDAVEETGNFEFTPDVDGTYAITIDINRDGEFGANDRLLLGRMSANVKSVVNWDGTDAAGATVPNASYPVKLDLRVGEYHFIAEDAETSGGGTNDDGTGDDDGLTILQATDATTVVGTQVYWDDETLLSGSSNLPAGVLSSTATTGAHRHTWGNFTSGGIGNQTFIDTYVFGNSTTESVTAIVAAANAAPTVDDDTFNVDENSANGTSVGTPTSNDPDGDFLEFTITAGNTGSVFAIDDLTGEITVNGTLDEETTDQYILTIEVTDQVSTDTATITININDINDAPVADDQAVGVAEDIAQAITLTANDQDLDGLTYSVVYGPTNGVLSGTAPNLTYTPNANYFGGDSFTFIANDGTVDSNTATITITVSSSNDAPVANAQSVGVIEDTPTAITLTASDVESDPLTYSIVSGPSNGVLSGTAPNLTYTPNGDYVGGDSFTFIANDGTVDSNTASITITVSNTNDAPVANAQSVGVVEDTPTAITLTASDADSDPLTYSIVSGPSNGVLSGTAPNLTYTPNGDYAGGDSFTFIANDGTVDSNTATITITVSNTNDAPVANAQSVGVAEDTPTTITLTASDADSDPLTYTIVSGPSNGVLSGTAPNLTYTPNGDYAGGDSFTFIANDGTVDSNTATITITVSNTNDAPVANAQSVGVVEDTPTAITLTASDADSDPLTYSIVSGPSNGVLSGTAPNLTYTPNGDYAGGDSFTFVANDATVDSNTATITITVSNINDAPTADPQSFTGVENVAINITLTGSDADSDPLTFSIAANPTNGTLSGSGANRTYTPNVDYVGSDSFTFVTNDGTVNSAAATISLTLLLDTDGDGNPDSSDPDDDGDGIPDDVEGNDDPDGDGIPNSEDPDSDGDGIDDSVEGDVDTDGDGTPDYLDEDSDNDGIDDSEEGTGDIDGDGTPNYLDDSADEDGDGIPDIVEGTGDSDGDGIADYLDPDSDNDGLPDSVESVVTGNDQDSDGIDDAFDVDQTGGNDANYDGIDDDIVALDTDQDDTPDYLDIDSDDDGIPDVIESVLREEDTDGDGIADAVDVDQTGGLDSDSDGIDDSFDASISGGIDADGDGIDDLLNPLSDRDGDGTPDYLDLDSDDDGISDTAESGITGNDADGDGIDDSYDVDLTGGFDINNDGIDDGGSVVDTDGDGVPDMHDLDSDNDSLFDTIEAGVSDDDLNALKDSDDTLVDDLIDTDGDGIADFRDIDSDNDGTNDIDGSDNADLDGNGDGEVDTTVDNDGDGIDDSQDLLPDVHGTRIADIDQDNDGIADITEGNDNTDGDVHPNYLDRDSDNDGLSDAFETDRPAPSGNDSDNDGLDDTYDVDFTGGVDANNDGVDDQFVEVDTDGDGVPDYLDTDADNDGISDSDEQVLVALSGNDSDNDGIDDAVDVDTTGGTDANADGIDDSTQNQIDLDNDGIPNFRDLDSDGDGILDSVEGDVDSDGDGSPDYLDLDSDGDGILDEEEGTDDADGDGTPNYLDLDSDGDGLTDQEEGNGDSDGDGLPDFLDPDSDNDGVLDEEEGNDDTDGDGNDDHVDPDSDNDGINDGDENGDFNNDGINDRLQATGMVETGLTGAGSTSALALLALFGLVAVRRKKQLAKLMLAVTSIVTLSAQANEPCEVGEAFGKGECWYFGGGIGLSKLRPDPNGTSWRTFDDSDTAFKLIAGFPFSEHLFLEAAYEDMGAAKMNNLNPSITETLNVDYQAFGASVGYWLKDQKEEWNLYAKAGLSFMDTKQGQYVDQDYGTQLTFGAGLQWRFTDNWFARLDLTSYDKDARIIGLTVAKYFGSSNKREPQKVVAPLPPAPPVKPEPKQQRPVPHPDLDNDGVLNEVDNCPNTPTGIEVNATGCPLMEQITLSVQFDSAKSLVKDEFLKEIEEVAAKIKQRGDVKVTVEGHTDWRGKQVNNQPLSESRAAAVAEILKQKTGLTDDSIEVIGYGELKPIADNNTPEGRYKNRRVVVIISQK
jgi:outer membrane protein OmpA-like peptidoglycan-associated protein